VTDDMPSTRDWPAEAEQAGPRPDAVEPGASPLEPPETDQATADGDAPDAAVAGAEDGASAAGKRLARPAPSAQRLEEEGEVAADYLEELLDIADLDGDIDIDVENGRASVSIVGDASTTPSLRRLAGRDGNVLEALQELTRLAVQARTGERTRLMLDVAGFRAARRVELERLASQAVEEVRRAGEPQRLAPMTPFERKVVHDAVAAAGLGSGSEGVEPHRCVVVRPAD